MFGYDDDTANLDAFVLSFFGICSHDDNLSSLYRTVDLLIQQIVTQRGQLRKELLILHLRALFVVVEQHLLKREGVHEITSLIQSVVFQVCLPLLEETNDRVEADDVLLELQHLGNRFTPRFSIVDHSM